jgi:hypothetical protein
MVGASRVRGLSADARADAAAMKTVSAYGAPLRSSSTGYGSQGSSAPTV